MSGIGQVTEEMKSEGRVEGVRASRRQPEREQQVNRHWHLLGSNHLYPASFLAFFAWLPHGIFTQWWPPGISCRLCFFFHKHRLLSWAHRVMSDAGRADFTYDVNEAGFSDDNLFSTIGSTSFARD